jgi:hypothetical protein
MNHLLTTSFPRAVPAALLALALLPGCSSRAWYEGMRASAESECRKLPPGGYEDCMARVNRQSYEDYEKERQRR